MVFHNCAKFINSSSEKNSKKETVLENISSPEIVLTQNFITQFIYLETFPPIAYATLCLK